MKPHVLIAVDQFTTVHLSRFEKALEGWATWARIEQGAQDADYRSALESAEVVIGSPRPSWLLSSPVNCLLLPSVGYERYVGKGLSEKPGFVLCNSAGAISSPVAEHFLAMMLGLTRRIVDHARDQPQKRWKRDRHYVDVRDTVLCVVGLGIIGGEIARRAQALDMRVIGVRKNPGQGQEPAEEVYGVEDLSRALGQADHVVSLLPGGAETEGFFSAAVFYSFKPGAYFYNLGRGSTQDESALVAALQSGHLAGAGLDVFDKEPLPEDSPLWEMENVIISPHVGGLSNNLHDRLCDLFVRILEDYRAGRLLENAIPPGRLL